MAGPVEVPVERIDLSLREFWDGPRDERDAAFAALRRHAPVRFFAEMEWPGIQRGPGYWAVTRYDDVEYVSRHPQLFCSRHGYMVFEMPEPIRELYGSMLNMDEPRHGRMRRIVHRGFTPRMVALVEEGVRRQAARIVDGVLERHPEGECDFVEEIASALPLRVICDMMGVPAEDHRRILGWTNVILGAGDPDYGGSLDDLLRASFEINEYAQRLGEERRRHPRSDVVSELMQATVEGEELTPEEFGSFFILLAVAGNETTRNAISHGMKALTDNPDQRRAWWDAFAATTPTAVEEIVRWASPVMYFRRTATADTELAGSRIREGDKLALFYISANRDESRFADPFTFDVRRDPNPQIGFGAGGPHFCLGASLARREIAVMFDEIRRRLPDLVVTGEPAMLSSQFVNGVKRMPCAWGPAAR